MVSGLMRSISKLRLVSGVAVTQPDTSSIVTITKNGGNNLSKNEYISSRFPLFERLVIVPFKTRRAYTQKNQILITGVGNRLRGTRRNHHDIARADVLLG